MPVDTYSLSHRAGVYSLADGTLGQLLYSYIFGPNTICVNLSPMARHLVVGFGYQMPRLMAHHHNTKQVSVSPSTIHSYIRTGQDGGHVEPDTWSLFTNLTIVAKY